MPESSRRRTWANADLPEAENKWFCKECGETCQKPLDAPNPFNAFEIIYGCPHCFEAESLVWACQVGECTQEATSGNPRAYGYRYVWTCHKHSPLHLVQPQVGSVPLNKHVT